MHRNPGEGLCPNAVFASPLSFPVLCHERKGKTRVTAPKTQLLSRKLMAWQGLGSECCPPGNGATDSWEAKVGMGLPSRAATGEEPGGTPSVPVQPPANEAPGRRRRPSPGQRRLLGPTHPPTTPPAGGGSRTLAVPGAGFLSVREVSNVRSRRARPCQRPGLTCSVQEGAEREGNGRSGPAPVPTTHPSARPTGSPAALLTAPGAELGLKQITPQRGASLQPRQCQLRVSGPSLKQAASLHTQRLPRVRVFSQAPAMRTAHCRDPNASRKNRKPR